jgi:hypothetical protein
MRPKVMSFRRYPDRGNRVIDPRAAPTQLHPHHGGYDIIVSQGGG